MKWVIGCSLAGVGLYVTVGFWYLVFRAVFGF